MPAIAVLAGLLIGLSLGALGGGGSILTVPALVYLLGQDARSATTGSLIVVGITSLIAMLPHARAGRVRVVQGLVFGALGTGGSYLGSALAAHVPAHVLLIGFAGLMLVVATLMLIRSTRPGPRDGGGSGHTPEPIVRLHPLRVDWPRAIRVVATASGVGLLTGFFGVGGGFVLVPALVLALDFPMTAAVGTSLLVIAVNSATALAARLGHGVTIHWSVIALLTVSAVLGSLLGSRLSARVSGHALTRAFAVLLLLVAVGVGLQSLLAP